MTSPLRSVLGLGVEAFDDEHLDAEEPDPAHRDTDPAPPLDDIVHDTSRGGLLAAFPIVRAAK